MIENAAPLTTRLPASRSWWTYLLRNRAAAFSAAFVTGALILALLGPLLYQNLLPQPQRRLRNGVYQDYAAINAGPSARHWLGADYLGRDTLTRLLEAMRVSMLVALVVEVINIGLGGSLGLLAGYFGGWVDMLISRLADMLFAFPGLLLAILISAIFGSAAREQYGS